MLYWDVNNGIARRSWARSPGAMKTVQDEMEKNALLQVTFPIEVEDTLLEGLFGE